MFVSYIYELAKKYNIKVLDKSNDDLFVEAFIMWRNSKIYNRQGIVLKGISAINNSIYNGYELFERVAPNTFKIL